MSSCCPSLDILLENMKKTRARNSFITKYGSSQKAIDTNNAIERLNTKYDTSFYMDHEKNSFSICGHREYGPISRRSGLLSDNVTMTLGSRELKNIENSNNTIKMIIDDENNYIVVSLTTMKNNGLLDSDALAKHRGGVMHDSGRFFYSWSIDELAQMGVILYSDIK